MLRLTSRSSATSRPARGAAVAAFALSALARTAFADPVARLRVERAAEASACPDREALGARIERTLGRHVFDDDGRAREPVEVTVTIERRDAGYVAFLTLAGSKQGVREIGDGGPTCEGLADALEVTVALLLDKEAPAPAAPRAATPARTAVAPASPRAATETETVRRSWVEAGLGPAFGVVGGPSLSLGGAFGYAFEGPFSLAVGARYVASHEQAFAGGTIATRLVAGSVRGCAMPYRGAATSFALCLEPSAGNVSAKGTGYATAEAADRGWFALGFGAEVRRSLWGRIGVGARVTGLAIARRQTFSVLGSGVGAELSRESALGEGFVSVALFLAVGPVDFVMGLRPARL